MRLTGVAALVLGCLHGAVHADCTLLVDADTKQVLRQDGDCATRRTPASTFKLAISLMGFDAGVLQSEHAPVLDWRPGDVDWRPEWKAPTDPARWMSLSVVWYSVRVTHALGSAKVQHYLDAFGYGNRDFRGHPGRDDGLDGAWITSSLEISPTEQAAFLGRLVRRELPVSPFAYDMTARIADLGPLPGGWTLHGKTGSASPQGPDGEPDRAHAIGWFVGWVEKDGRRVVFVRQTRDEAEQDTPAGLRAREAFVKALPELLAAVSSGSVGTADGRGPAHECVRKMIPLVCDPDRTDASGRRVPGACRCGPEMCME